MEGYIVHLYVRPESVAVTGEGDGAAANLMSFGYGKLEGRKATDIQNQPDYVATEIYPCVKGEYTTTWKLDIYSLGAVIYEMICGELYNTAGITEVVKEKFPLSHMETDGTVMQCRDFQQGQMEKRRRDAKSCKPAQGL